jgi:hypothetical protein
MKRAIPRLRDIAVGLFSIFLLCFITQAVLYSFRNKIDSLYSRVGEDNLYATTPCLSKVTDYGKGNLGLRFTIGTGLTYTLHTGSSELFRITAEHEFRVQLTPGSNQFSISEGPIVKGTFTLNYVPNEAYALAGNRDYPLGVISLKKSSLCIGEPVLLNYRLWNLRGIVDSIDAQSDDDAATERIITQVIVELEAKRGTPSSAAESAPIHKVREMIHTNRSQVWCSQIAAYTVASLGNSIAVRMVTSNGALLDSEILAGGHAFIEVINKTANKWMLIDPTNYILRVSISNGEPLTARDLQYLIALGNGEIFRTLFFRIVNPVSGVASDVPWENLDPTIRENVLLYFSPRSKLYFHSGSSAIYTKDFFSKLDDWVSLDRRFLLSHIGDIPVLAWVRVISFFFMILSFAGFIAIAIFKLIGFRYFKDKLQ